ncbi:MAG: transcription termination factor Rho [Actinobacteria bacterium]|nr:transcription termination factor Rho [Actinomycetota bacterium]
MEQNSITEGAPEQSATPVETPAAEAAEAAPVRRRASRRVTTSSAADAAEPAEAAAPAAAEAPAAEETAAPKKRVSRARKKAESVEPAAEATTEATTAAAETPAAEATEAAAPAAEATVAAPKKATQSRRRRQTSEAPAAEGEAAESAPAAEANAEAPKAEADDNAAEAAAPKKRNTRGRGRKAAAENAEQAAEQGEQKPAEAEAAEKPAEGEEKAEGGNSRGNGSNNGNGNDGQTRSSRTRQRERKRRGGSDDEPEITEDDVLLPIAGILDVLDNYAFVRTSGYLPGTGDVYVSLGQVKKYGLRKGDAVVGAIRQPRDGDNGGRQKYNAIVKVDSINSKPFEENQTRPEFADFTPVYPTERIRLETESGQLGARVIDLFAPIGKGQRGLIVGQHEAGKSTALRQIAQAVAQNQPDAHLMLVLVDERPEEVTELTRTVNGEVIASTFDRPAEDHATIVELAIERAKRLVELGHDVIVLIDSLTSLARAYNLAAPAATRVPAGSLDAAAVFPVKRLLSAARNIENGGSLTVIATVSAQPESQLDAALLGELEGVANMQLRLSGDAADRRVFPAVDLVRSSTRNEALLTSEAEAKLMSQLRHALADENQEEGLESVLKRLGETSSNVEFLALAQRGRA